MREGAATVAPFFCPLPSDPAKFEAVGSRLRALARCPRGLVRVESRGFEALEGYTIPLMLRRMGSLEEPPRP